MDRTRTLKSIVNQIDFQILPPSPCGRSLEVIKVFLVDCPDVNVPKKSRGRDCHTFAMELWFGDTTIPLNSMVGHLKWWETGAVEGSEHLATHPVWNKVVQFIQFEILAQATGL
jgi:hypothetical protein